MTVNKNEKYLYVIGSLDRGGCETHLLQVLPELQSRGTAIVIFLLARPGILASEFEKHDITLIKPWISTPPNTRKGKIFRIIRLITVCLQFITTLLTLRPNIVHFFLPASYWIGGPITYLFSRAKRIMSRRSLNNYMCDSNFIKSHEKKLHQKMHFLLGNSKRVVTELIDDESSPKEHTGLIHNGIVISEPTSTKASIRQDLQIPEDNILMTIVANLIPYKGHKDLIEALEIVARQTSNWSLLIVGRDDGIGDDLKTLAEANGLSQNIIFTGLRSDINNLYNASDIGLLVSHEEGFSNAILEGMAAKLPMIVTDVGGNAEAIIDGHNGFVVPAKTPSELAQAILKLLEDKKLRKSMGAAGRKRLEENFTLEKCVDKYEYLYNCLLNDQTPTKLLPEIE